ncbi:MAG: right-handed parallel beta-helix repeat-containing protein [Acidobacteria bacterium]|nr:right-handed parallel beta-helix repeat-containing protein [Acidobacteriota bacterium]
MAIPLRILTLLAFALSAHAETCARGETVEIRNRASEPISIEGPCRVIIVGVTIKGDRAANPQPQALPPSNKLFADHYTGNGIRIVGAVDVRIADTKLEEIAGFAVLVSGARNVRISRVTVRNSGSRNAKGRNNTTGGILLEDGVANFTVEDSTFENILGNAVWTHSRYGATRNGPGYIRKNKFSMIGRDAVQIGHARRVVVVMNTIAEVGYPEDAIDVEGGGTPVGIDTAGDVDETMYAANVMREINGKCIDLDGFHHGNVSHNECMNTRTHAFGHFGVVMNNTNPDMQSVGITIEKNRFDGMRFGGIFVIGAGHLVRDNVLTNLQTARCSDAKPQPGCTHFEGEPDLLRAGIYFGRRAERTAATRGNVVEGNRIEGWRMDRVCIGYAPGVKPEENRVANNTCRHTQQ